MTLAKEIHHVAASVHQRLRNLARDQGVDFNRVLQRYAAERFLYRLSVSSEVDRFTLKGAALLWLWAGRELRRFLGAVCDSLIEESPFTQAWPGGRPWRPGIPAGKGGEDRD